MPKMFVEQSGLQVREVWSLHNPRQLVSHNGTGKSRRQMLNRVDHLLGWETRSLQPMRERVQRKTLLSTVVSPRIAVNAPMLTIVPSKTRRREYYGLISSHDYERPSRWTHKRHQRNRIWWQCKQSVGLPRFDEPPTDKPKHITRPTILQPAELSRLRGVIEAFPPRHVAEFLLSVCIKHGTDTFFYFDQAQFSVDIDQFYTDPNSHLRSDSSFVCLAMAAFALGSQWTLLERPDGPAPGPRPDDGDPGRVFYSQAKTLIPDIIDRPCLRSIQASFVLGVYLMPASAIGSSYVYMGLALRKALAFDLHQNTDDQTLDEREREVRRRLWWSIYSLERFVCALKPLI